MARIFEALGPKGNSKPSRKAKKPQPVENNLPEKTSEPVVSFIEVGVGGILDASPDVLKFVQADLHPEVKVKPEESVVKTEVVEEKSQILPIRSTEDDFRDLMGELVAGFPVRKEGILMFVTPPSVYLGESLLRLAEKAATWGEAVLVDSRDRGAEITKILGLESHLGWNELISGKAELENVLVNSGISGLKIIPSGNVKVKKDKGPRLITRSPRTIVRDIRREFPMVMLDGGTWNEEPGTLSLARESDGVCILVPEAKAGSTSVDELIGRVEDSGSRLAGVLVLPSQERGSFRRKAA